MITDIKAQVKELAVKQGIETSVAEALAQKCYDDIVWRPYGGATSFSEVDAAKAAQKYAYEVEDQSYTMRGIIENIVADSDMDTGMKASAIKSAADDFQSRVDNITSMGNKGFWDKVKEIFVGSKEAEVVELPTANGFKVFKDKEGKHRWLSFTTNAFADKEKELFTTEALEEAIEFADESKERGPLLVWHVPSAEIGQCDFQAMAGRFLVESGTFSDTPLGQKALDYYTSTKEEQRVSVGYTYIDGDELDGQYDWLRFRERSVLPAGKEANLWTSFNVILGEDTVKADKAMELRSIFGESLASVVIATAEEKTKELEGKVRFKEMENPGELSEEDLKELYQTVKSMPEGSSREKWTERLTALNGGKSLEEETTAATVVVETPAEAVVVTEDQFGKIAAFMADVSEKLEVLGSVKEAVEGLQTKVKELEKSDDEKVSNIIRPRLSVMVGNRPTESNANVVTDQKALDVLKEDDKETENTSPASPYLQDLLRGRVVRA